MNIKEYISSGILESYVLGLTSAEETLEIENNAALYPEIKAEIEAIQSSLNNYASTFDKAPPAALKGRIWSKIQESANTMESSALPPSGKVISFPTSKQSSLAYKWMVAASFILFLLGSALNIFLYNKWKDTERELVTLNSEKEYIAQQFHSQQTIFEQTQANYNFVVSPETKTIILKGVPKFSDLKAAVYWNTKTKSVFIAANTLPVQPSDKQYQLWAIVDGKPVDAGVFDISPDNAGLQKMKDFGSAQAFAVTLENRGGSPTPTMDAMYVIGEI
ncbi:MAG: anti-sigma factor [Bacteroidia bacterium]|nr:anti-sigma factor [Bacteroidota bacterium]MBP9082789.1 anti-sigma factor [Bacteroidia bacterium]